MLLVRDGKLRLDDRVTRFLHNFGVYGKTHITFRHLLSHCSGLAAWRPFYKDILQIEKRGEKINFLGSTAAKEYVYQAISRERPEAPAGSKAVYSDLGFMLLGALVEMASRHDARSLLSGAHLPAARACAPRRSSTSAWCARGASSRSPR